MPTYGVAAKHNVSYDTWSRLVRLEPPYIVAARDNGPYEPWDEIIEVLDNGSIVATRDTHSYKRGTGLAVLNRESLRAERENCKALRQEDDL
jgi:predicted amidohydrolase